MRSHASPDHHGAMDPAPTPYMIRVDGDLRTTWLSAFPTMTSEHQGTQTVLTGSLDRTALLDVLAGIGALGLELVEFRQVAADAAPRRRG
jgi:hypothetical protein